MEPLPLNAATVNALAQALGALVFATVRRLPPEAQAAFSADLASLARLAEHNSHTTLETLLLDLHEASIRGPRAG
jgi:hypothetical protein